MTDWIDPQVVFVPDALRDAVGGHPLVATMLVRRGITTPAAARAFLDPGFYEPTPSSDLPDLERAADRILDALKTGQPIAIWGDFDADGQTATALLVEALRRLSEVIECPQATPIRWRVPTRQQGHGIHLPTLDELLNKGVSLLITCDTGVDAFSAIERAAAHGCEVVVTDHHDLPSSLPPALAVVNPKRLPSHHPLRELPGVGVAFKLIQYLYNGIGCGGDAEPVLDLVALGIVADVAKQVADVRYLLQCGLEVLRATNRVGLRALIEQAELQPDGLTEEHIGYQISPRLNALGRLGDANRGVELLLTRNIAQARILAAEVDGLNFKRRLIVEQTFKAALNQIERDPALLDHRALVVAGRDWHPGVLGLVANRLAERFQRPAVAVSLSEGLARGSARSVPGCDIHSALKRNADLLLRFGGHPGAAGLSMDPSHLEAFRRGLSRAVEAVWDPAASSPGLQVDAYVSLDQLSLELVSELERLAPFGPANPAVQLATRNLRVEKDAIIGREREHRRLVVADESGVQQTVLWWGGGDQSLPEGRFDLVYALRARDYRGEQQLQVEWIDARPLRSVAAESTHPALKIVDWRQEPNPRTGLEALPKQELVVWAEVDDPGLSRDIRVENRLGLSPSAALIIWTAPPGPVELARAVEAVTPSTVCLVAFEPATDKLRVFLERLMGMVKHDVRTRDGHVNVNRLAAAIGHREPTVRAGLQWLEVRGKLCIVETSEESITLQMGGEPSRDLHGIESRLRCLFDETAAYRRHFRTAPVEALGIAS